MRSWGGGAETATAPRPRLRHARRHGTDGRIGALDGLRAVAVAAVVAYHLWPGSLPAGYLGVDLFMVLSGFLITGLLLDEHARRSSVALGGFWGRRFRRLVPALLALVGVVALWVHVVGPATLEWTVRRQGIAALLYVGNWRLVADHTSYAALGTGPSPLLHLWSLAIEEQFYVVWPLVVLAALALGRGRRLWVGIAAAAGTLVSVAWMAHLYHPGRDPLRLYYGTDTRAQTLLLGAAAAVVVRSRWGAAVGRVAARAGILAFAAVLLVMVAGDRPEVLYRGGFAAVALLAAVATVAVTNPGPLATTLDRAPLRGLGRVSYGVYLWHWPVIVLVTSTRTGLHGPALDGFRLVLIALATAASWLLVEQPYRQATVRVAVRLAPAGVAAAAATLLLLPATPTIAYATVDTTRLAPIEVADASPVGSTPTVDLRTPVSLAADATAAPAPTAPATSVPIEIHTVMVIGDSGTFDLAPGLIAGFTARGVRVVNGSYPGEALTEPAGEQEQWSSMVDRYSPDLVIVGLGVWDKDFLAQHTVFDYASIAGDTAAMLSRKGAHVLWLSVLPGADPKPMAQTAVFSSLSGRLPGVVEYLDISRPLLAPDGTSPRSIDGRLLRKPDAWHLCPDGAAAVVHEILQHVGLDSDGWDTGRWRTDPRYDDPPGGCG